MSILHAQSRADRLLSESYAIYKTFHRRNEAQNPGVVRGADFGHRPAWRWTIFCALGAHPSRAAQSASHRHAAGHTAPACLGAQVPSPKPQAPSPKPQAPSRLRVREPPRASCSSCAASGRLARRFFGNVVNCAGCASVRRRLRARSTPLATSLHHRAMSAVARARANRPRRDAAARHGAVRHALPRSVLPDRGAQAARNGMNHRPASIVEPAPRAVPGAGGPAAPAIRVVGRSACPSPPAQRRS